MAKMSKESKQPMDEKFSAVAPEAISADKASLSFLVIEQVNRINFLLTAGLAGTNEFRPQSNIVGGVLFGLRSLEAMIGKDLPETYFEKVKPIKQNLFKPKGFSYGIATSNQKEDDEAREKARNDLAQQYFLYQRAPNHALISCMSWFDLLIKELCNLGLMPAKQKPLHF